MRPFIILLLTVVGIPPGGWIATVRAADKPEVTGKWKVTRTASDEKLAGFTLHLEMDGDKLTGKVVWADAEETKIAGAELKDGTLSFKVKRGTFVQQYGGKVSGDTIKGKWATSIAVFDWEAKREPRPR